MQGHLITLVESLINSKRLLRWLWEAVMKGFVKKVKNFLVSEDGPTAVEYAVMLALIIIVCLVAIGNIGTNANQTFSTVAGQLSQTTGTGS